MTQRPSSSITVALDELVNQFSDPLSFYRELVQNALDAGSEELEIAIDREDDGPSVVARIQVQDWGEGMTREIVEKRLTRLFSSSKDGDMTKIGKFGIGFVSVFAIEPEIVCIDTAREGEALRVIFDVHRRFKILRLDEPIEGTKVEILKRMEASAFDEFVARSERVLRFWCRHSHKEIRFGGRRINEAFDLPDACRVAHDDGFSHITVAHPDDGAPFYGFYNCGLTLQEGTDRFYDCIAFKASSPHLEHTLTRDNVIEDAGFERVMSTVEATIAGPLCGRAFELLQAEVLARGPSIDRWYAATAWHLLRGDRGVHDQTATIVARRANDTPVRLEELRRRHRDDVILLSVDRTHLSDAAERAGFTVLLGTPTPELLAFLQPAFGSLIEILPVEDRFCTARPLDEGIDGAALARLGDAVSELLGDVGGKLESVQFGHFDACHPRIRDRIAISQAKFGEATPLDEAVDLGTGLFSRRRVLVVNVDDPAIATLVPLAQREPFFAAMVLVKMFFLGRRLDVEFDGRLAAAAMERRWQSSNP